MARPRREVWSYHLLSSKPIRHNSPLDMPLASLSEKRIILSRSPPRTNLGFPQVFFDSTLPLSKLSRYPQPTLIGTAPPRLLDALLLTLSFQITESLGCRGDFRQWEHLHPVAPCLHSAMSWSISSTARNRCGSIMSLIASGISGCLLRPTGNRISFRRWALNVLFPM
jgi:hypothetical protein